MTIYIDLKKGISTHEAKTGLRATPAGAPSYDLGLHVPGDTLSSICALLMEWQRRWSTRAHLRDLDAYLLDDVGMSPTDRDREVRKPFWRR